MKRVKKPAVPVNTGPSRTDIDGRHAAKLLAAQSILDQVKVRSVCLSSIATSITRRAIRPETVNALAQSMKEIGLINPITIRPAEWLGFYLIAGRNRLEAARKLKWEEIRAIVLEGLSADEAELREIDENLIRAELSPAEQAAHHARRKELHEQLHPETKRGGDRKSAKRKSKPQNADLKSYSEDAAKKTGKSRDTIERAVRRGTDIPNVGELAGTSLDQGSELDALAKMSPERQAELIERAKGGEEVSARPDRKADRQQQAPALVPNQTADECDEIRLSPTEKTERWVGLLNTYNLVVTLRHRTRRETGRCR
jgi:ParB-like chromosome segregation protein Spo0J